MFKSAAVVCVFLRSGVRCSAVEFVCELESGPRAWYRKLKHLRKRKRRKRKKKKQKQTRKKKLVTLLYCSVDVTGS
jgi:hypothetical protein